MVLQKHRLRTETRSAVLENRQHAKDASLIYVSDSLAGIERKRKGKTFYYCLNGNPIKDELLLDRVKKLAIPPAWSKVWICTKANGHIQATGFDCKNRKQYRYHYAWSNYRNQTKFYRLLEFGKTLPLLRKKIESDISNATLTKEKVLAAIVCLMEHTLIRIGNNEYEKLYGSYGLTTLKDNHVQINGSAVKFSFKGKKGIHHSITLKNKRLARIVKACRDIPGKELFQYFNEDGSRSTIDSGMVNDYIKVATKKDFSAKDFRTWAGSLSMLSSLKSMEESKNAAEIKKSILIALDEVSSKLGNTRTVCKNYYVYPGIIKLYEQNRLHRYLKEMDQAEKQEEQLDLSQDEKVLMKILKKI